MNTLYVQAHADLIQATADKKTELARHKLSIEAIDRRIKAASEQIKLGDSGIDLQKVAIATSVLNVGPFSRGGDDKRSVITDAIADIIAGPIKLRREFFGTKSYDRWYGQRWDCEYGCSPKHGSIIFSVGLTNFYRKQELTSEEKDACVYYLNNIERIQAVKAEVAQK